MKKNKIGIIALITILCISFCILFGSNHSKLFNKQILLFAEQQNFDMTAEQADVDIFTYADLKTFANSVNNGNNYSNKTVALFANIEIESDFVTIGKYVSSAALSLALNKPFKGKFYGNGFYFSNLNASLFGYTDGAKIVNLEIASGNIQKSAPYLGAIASYANNTNFDRCKNLALVSNGYDLNESVYTGGLVGYANNCNFTLCSNQSNIKNTSSAVKTSYVGGLVGYSKRGSINNCYVYDSSITAIAEDASKAPKNILSGKQTKYLTKISSWFDAKVNEYINQREKLYSEDQEQNKLLEQYWDYKDKSRTYVVYGDWEGGWEKTSWWPHVPYYNFHHKWNPTKENSWETFWARQDYGLKAAGVWLKLLVKNPGLALEASWIELKNTIANGLKNSLERLYEQYKSITANNHYSLVKKMSLTVNSVPAYAMGITYSNGTTITNCYTSQLTLNSGINQNIYDYKLYFVNDIKLAVGTAASAYSTDIDIKITQTANLKGLISNTTGNNCYYFDDQYKNLELVVSATNMGTTGNVHAPSEKVYMNATYEMKGSVLGGFLPDKWFDYQKAQIQINKQSSVSIYGAVNGNGSYCKIDVPNLTTSYPITFENCNLGKKSNKNTELPDGLDPTIWGISEHINDGYPYLLYRYWENAS